MPATQQQRRRLLALVACAALSSCESEPHAATSRARMQLDELRHIIDVEYVLAGTCPPAPGAGLPALSRGRRPADPWGRPLVYRAVAADAYELRSLGPDGVDGTGDDLQVQIELELKCRGSPPRPPSQ